jgi:transcriptional regulator with XRE-family HTH domain
MNDDFVLRLRKTFDNETMAVVARRLGIPHATVRNYFKEGRLPAPEVLMKIAAETGVSLNWLLMGRGEMFVGDMEPIGLGKFIESKIGEMIDRKLAGLSDVEELGDIDLRAEFDIEAAVLRLGDPQAVMDEWFRHDGRECPQDYGIVFFRGWETFSIDDKIAAIRDARRVLDRSLKN